MKSGLPIEPRLRTLGRNVTASLYVDNIADNRGVTAATTFGTYLNDFYIRPRTVGVQFDWTL